MGDFWIVHFRLMMSERLGQARTYEAQYLALAEKLGVEFWTADQRLVNGARRIGMSWVRWVGEE